MNSLYCIFWDVLYDWSLGSDFRRSVFPLRQTLVYPQRWPYLIAIPVDVVLRFNWIAYVLWAAFAQHSSWLSFLVALSEVLRRSMWVLFRLENEQASNTARAVAFKIRRLPYHIEASPGTSASSLAKRPAEDDAVDNSGAERQSPAVSTLQRFGSEIRAAHTRDYVRRRPPGWEEASDDEEE